MQQDRLLCDRQTSEGIRDVYLQIGRKRRGGGLRRIVIMGTGGIDRFAPGLEEAGVGDSVQPGGEARIAPELAQLTPRQHEGFLCQVIGPRLVAVHKATKLRADHTLMATHKFLERTPIVFHLGAGNQGPVGASRDPHNQRCVSLRWLSPQLAR